MTSQLNTGDIVLFKGNTIVSKILQCFGDSEYSHVGIILKNPTFINGNFQEELYIMESSFTEDMKDSEDDIVIRGVQIHKLSEVLEKCQQGSVFARSINCVRDEKFNKKIVEIHDKIHGSPYDINIFDWFLGSLNIIDPNISILMKNHGKTSTFWCSAMVTFILIQLKIIDENVDWTIIAPKELSSNGKILKFKCEVGEEFNIY